MATTSCLYTIYVGKACTPRAYTIHVWTYNMLVLSGMAPRNPITDVLPSPDDGDGLGLDQVSPVITEENYEQKQQPLKIVWQNVFIQLGIHLAALYGLIRIPWSHPLTWLWSKYGIILFFAYFVILNTKKNCNMQTEISKFVVSIHSYTLLQYLKVMGRYSRTLI